MSDEVPAAPVRPAPLAGYRIGLLEARLASEAAALVRRLGGTPISAPALREHALDDSGVAEFLDRLRTGGIGFAVLQTGAGVRALFEAAERLSREQELRDSLARASLVSRGPKPAAALAARGLRPSVSVESPYTTTELAAALAPLPLRGASVALVHYGEPNEPLRALLREQGAQLDELSVYEWLLPEDTTPLLALLDALVAGEIDAVAFTSQIQVRHLFEVASPAREGELIEALRRTVIGAVGPTCADALRRRGVQDLVVPDNPKLGPLFAALASRLAERRKAGEDSLLR